MSSKTKFILYEKREFVYTLILIFFSIILVILLVLMFLPKSSRTSKTQNTIYYPGIYASTITLNQSPMELEIRVDQTRINSIHLSYINDSTAVMYPLLKPSLDWITYQICQNQSLENIYYEKSRQYTSQMLLAVIQQTLQKAKAS